MTKPLKALRLALQDLRDGDAFYQCGCDDTLERMIELADDTGLVRATWSDLGVRRQWEGRIGLEHFAGLSGKSGAYRIDFAKILDEAASYRRETAAQAAAEAAADRVRERDLQRFRRTPPG